MRRVICLILALVMMLSLACTVFATTPADSAADGGTPGDTPGTDIPETGDNIMNWVMLMVVAMIALAATTVIYRKFA